MIANRRSLSEFGAHNLGVALLHELGYVHHDISPRTLMLSPQGLVVVDYSSVVAVGKSSVPGSQGCFDTVYARSEALASSRRHAGLGRDGSAFRP